MRAPTWALVAAVAALACTPLRMTPPETGSAGEGGTAAGEGGTAGVGGAAGASAGTGGAGPAGSGGGVAGASAGTSGGRGGTSGGAGGTTVEPPGLIAFWRFNENNGSDVADSSGNNQTLTLSTGGGWTTGHEGAGFSFDGDNDVAGVTPLVGQPLSDYPVIALTFSAWVKPAAAAASRPFATAVARTHEDNAFQDFWLGLADGKPACTIHSPSKEGPIASAAAPATVWTHIACTYGLAGVATLFVNGVEVDSSSTDQNLGPIPTAILVGASETSGLEDFFLGAIDDVRIYRTTLSPAQVASIAR